jgi:hypothetical protein
MSNLEKIKKIINFFSYLIFIFYILILYRYREKIFEGLENLNTIDNFLLLSIILLVLLSIFNKSIKFGLINSLFGLKDIKKIITIFCSSFFLCLAPGRLVEIYRIKLISEKENSSISKSIYINILDKSTDLICLGLYGIIGLVIFLPNVFKEIFIENSQLLIFLFFLLIFLSILAFLFFKKHTEKFFFVINFIAHKKRKILTIFLFTLVSWAPEIFSFYYLFHTLVNINLEPYLVTSYYTVANVLGGLIPLPAGAIGFEGTLIYLLSNYLPLNILVSIIFIHRTTLIGTTFLLGTLFFFYSKITNLFQK